MNVNVRAKDQKGKVLYCIDAFSVGTIFSFGLAVGLIAGAAVVSLMQ